jgi:ribosome-associated toxin RatA of RatAB toxin-antitoxin module
MTREIYTVNARSVAASPERVYALAANVADWPRLLSHYRYVRVLEQDDEVRTVAMGARHSGIPVRWTAIQETRPDRLEIRYRHIRGVTRGMDVVWRVEPAAGGARATITHRLRPEWWWLRPALSRWMVGTVFVMAIAERTLAGIAARAEAEGAGR